MKREEFNLIVERLEKDRNSTLINKNANYSAYEATNDSLHNFKVGAELMGCTPAQCAWNYMTKHLVSLRDKVMENDFSNEMDLLEKVQDIQNYLTFIYAIAIEEIKDENPVIFK